MKSRNERRLFLKRLAMGIAATTLAERTLSANDNTVIPPFNVTMSDSSRTEQEIFRDIPSVLDYDGVYNSLTQDSYEGLQRAFDNER